MRLAKLAVTVVLASGFIVVAGASPAGAAVPNCTSFVVAPFKVPGTEQVTPSHNNSRWCVMGRGNHSFGVWALQRTLNICYNAGLAEDAVYGPKTEAAVTWVQAVVRARVDGVYGPETMQKMEHHVVRAGTLRPTGYCGKIYTW